MERKPENRVQTEEIYNNILAISAPSRPDWREWLETNHAKVESVWLIIYHKPSGIPSVYYDEAVEEALCFGWVDSKPNKRDHQSYYQFFARRNPKSKWSKLNRERVERLIAEGLMTSAGFKMIDLAKLSGTWNALDEVEQLIVPKDMEILFAENPVAKGNWDKFPPSARRAILEWILNAKKPETRAKRITETVEKAANNIKANMPRQ